MYYGAIKKCDIANGEGIRVSLFVSGCRNGCPGCFQPETWDFTYGKLFDNSAEELILSALANASVGGITILGGEPLEPENQTEICRLLCKVKERFPEKNVWLYTGATYEQLVGREENRYHTEYISEILSLVNILVDGPYIKEEKSLGLRFRGSKNQRIIDMDKTRDMGEVVIWSGTKEDKCYDSKN
jgi:anaerobic ribonucleoside-triphosphate reductase activating protein